MTRSKLNVKKLTALSTFVGAALMTSLSAKSESKLDLRQVPKATLEYIKQAAEGDHLALEGGHIALDGHVMPYPFFQPHEILYLDRLSKLRHQVVWQADQVQLHHDWQDQYLTANVTPSDYNATPSELVGGRHTNTTYKFELPALPKSKTGWERFFVVKPLDMSIVGWPETTIYVDGEAKAALQRKHFYWSLDTLLDDSKPQQITLKSFGQYDQPRGYRQISVSERNPAIDEIYWTLRVLIEAASIIPDSAKGHAEIRLLIDNVMSELNLELAGSNLFQQRAEKVAKNLKAEFKNIEALADSKETLNVLFHGHLDSAWRWTLKHTDEKIQRLTLNNLYLMERFDEYKYVFTTPYHYERMAALYPELYQKVKQQIDQGNWIANGSTYVETDLNLPGGESVVRQFLYGLDYYQNELGVNDNTLFLPDTFGFPTYLPQIAQNFGLDHVIAMRTNIPNIDHSIYRWQGLDGSEILVNGLTSPAWEYPYVPEIHNHYTNGELVTTYNAPNSGPRLIAGTWQQFKDKDVTDNQLFLVGWGDGGGGGTEDHVEILKRVTSLPSLPKVDVTPLHDYIKIQTDKADKFALFDKRILPPRDWVERTFLMSNGIKMKNRAIENLFRETEALAVQASLFGYDYPKAQFKTWWKSLLVNHFHDIITGMAVPEVLMQANDELAELQNTLTIFKTTLMEFVANSEVNQSNNQSNAKGFLVYNGAGVTTSGVVSLGNHKMQGKSLIDKNGQRFEVMTQDNELFVKTNDLAPLSFTQLFWSEKSPEVAPSNFTAKKQILENSLVKVTFDQYGQITSFIDKEVDRELVPSGKVMNQFMTVVTQNRGHDDAVSFKRNATFSDYYKNDFAAGFTLTIKFNDSIIKQTVSIAPNSKLINFANELNWVEDKRLEVNFPLAINSRDAKHGLQFGHETMPRSSYRDEDRLLSPTAAFEWADVSERGYGVSIFDHTRYGYDLKTDGIRLNLTYGQLKHGYSELKDVSWGPKESGEQGGESFKYAIYPHVGDISKAEIVKQAKAYNAKPTAIPLNSEQDIERRLARLISGLPSNIVIESIKQAEHDDSVIIRMFEAENKQTNAQVEVHAQFNQVFAAKMDESTTDELELTQRQLTLKFKAFEIKTIKLK